MLLNWSEKLPQAFTPANIISGFKKAGIWPYDENVFTEADFLCSYVTDGPHENEEVDRSTNIDKTLHSQSQGVNSNQTSSGISDGEPSTLSYPLPTVQIKPSKAQSFAVNPEIILPFPKAGQRKATNQGRKKGKTVIVTDTPNKAEIEAEYHTRMDMKQKKEERLKSRSKKYLFINMLTQGEIKIKKTKKIPLLRVKHLSLT